jgi:putative tryptophan/tyrosine transport system substrate-binding protein
MKRRALILALGGAAAAWPFAARAQQGQRMRRIGVLMPFAEFDPEGRSRVATFLDGLRQLGWFDGRNLRIDYRWTADPAARLHADVLALVEQMPEAILVSSTAPVAALLQATRTIPIVFAQVLDPVRQGFVASLAHPGGNATGFTNFESAMLGKWLELAKDLAPQVTRALLIYHPETTPHDQFVRPVETAAPPLGLQVTAVGVRDASGIVHAFDDFAPRSDAAVIVFPAVVTGTHRQLILDLAARNRTPAVYPFRYFVVMGGLASYGISPLEAFRRAASYIDRILKGEKPANLPVQQPTKYELVINLKTAKALGLDVPATLLARADEVIE